MASRAIIMAFHKYTPFGGEFYEPILDFQIQTLKKYQDEFDMLYLIDSTWDIGSVKESWGISKVKIIKVNPHLRYYDAYKFALPLIKEDLVLFMDNDTVVYKKGVIKDTFNKLELWDVVTIIDQIGTYTTDKLKNGNKMCPYWFATRKELLMKYLNVDWSPDAMPYTETFGLLTEAMLNDGVKVYEWPEDKSDFPTKDLGYYHIRAGSTPAYLLAIKHYGDIKTYWDYLKNQPKIEYLRQCEWYKRMGGDPSEIIEDSKSI